MAKTELNVLFKKIQKDDKKEVLEFHVQGDELPHSDELVKMAGSIVVLNVTNSQAGEISVEFKSIQRDSKKTTLKFNVKGDSDDQMNKLYAFAGRSVLIALESSQMSIEDFNNHEGVSYSVGQDGTAVVTPGQLTLDDVQDEENKDESDPIAPVVGNASDASNDDDLLD